MAYLNPEDQAEHARVYYRSVQSKRNQEMRSLSWLSDIQRRLRDGCEACGTLDFVVLRFFDDAGNEVELPTNVTKGQRIPPLRRQLKSLRVLCANCGCPPTSPYAQRDIDGNPLPAWTRG